MIPLLALLAVVDTGWTTPDKVLLAASTTAIIADCVLTDRNLRRNPANQEHNPILGSRPSRGELAAACAIGIGWTVAIADLLPKKLRRIGLVLLLGIEADHVRHNLGLRWSF